MGGDPGVDGDKTSTFNSGGGEHRSPRNFKETPKKIEKFSTRKISCIPQLVRQDRHQWELALSIISI